MDERQYDDLVRSLGVSAPDLSGGINWDNSRPFMTSIQGGDGYLRRLDCAVTELGNKFSENPEIMGLSGHMVELPGGTSGFIPRLPISVPSKMAEALRHILHNCAHIASHPLVFRDDRQQRNDCLAIPMAKSAYGPQGNGLSYQAMRDAVMVLGAFRPNPAEGPWLLTKKGYNTPGRQARLTRLAPSKAFKSWMVHRGLVFPNHPKGQKSKISKASASLLWVKPSQQEGSPDQDVPQVLERPLQGDEMILPVINRRYEKRKIGLHLDDYADYESHWDYRRGRSKLPNTTAGRLYRTFSGSDCRGGRLFGHWVQNVPSDLRPRCLRIEGQPCAELDYGSMQLVLLYATAGVPVPEGDLYVKQGEMEGRRDRMKQVLTVSVGTSTRHEAISALRKKLASENASKAGRAESLYDEFWSRHPEVCPHDRDEPMWPVLQHEESRIALRVIRYLVDQAVIVIPIHDSFIVQRRHTDRLRAAMERAFSDLWPGVQVIIREK